MTIQPVHPLQPEQRSPRLARLAAQAKGVLKTYRTPLLIIAALVFIGGFALSVSRLELTLADISIGYILLSGVIIVPLAFAYGAFNFMIMARGAGLRVPFTRAFQITCVAQFAEFLPIPGGALVRGGALMQRGTGAVDSAAHVTVNALLWVACAALVGGLSLGLGNPVALAIFLGGSLGIAGCTAWLTRKAGVGIALAALAMRFVGLVFAGARLFAAFAAIGVTLAVLDLYPFVFATILGSAAAIAPGGLGISEVAAAALATLSTIPPEAAFLAVALNRLIGFAASGVAAGILAVFSSNGTSQT
ncbi:MAG: hypothetical protein AAF687_06450 [Pseudomonadota bacterium]